MRGTWKVAIGDLGTDLGAISKTVTLTSGVLQGSIPGPMLFMLHEALLGAICRKHGIMYHQYADDQEIYLLWKNASRKLAHG